MNPVELARRVNDILELMVFEPSRLLVITSANGRLVFFTDGKAYPDLTVSMGYFLEVEPHIQAKYYDKMIQRQNDQGVL